MTQPSPNTPEIPLPGAAKSIQDAGRYDALCCEERDVLEELVDDVCKDLEKREGVHGFIRGRGFKRFRAPG